MSSQHESPITLLAGGYHPASYWPDEYLVGALATLEASGLLVREADRHDHDVAARVLEKLDDIGLDVTDVFAFGTVWAFRSTGLLAGSPTLDEELTGWRTWEETDHACEELVFLPDLPTGGGAQ